MRHLVTWVRFDRRRQMAGTMFLDGPVGRRRLCATAWCLAACLLVAVECRAGGTPPSLLIQDQLVGVLQFPDGHFEFYNTRAPHTPVRRQTLSGEAVELQPATKLNLPAGALPVRLMVDDEGRLHTVYQQLRGEGKKIAVDRFIDLWHRRTTADRATWEEARPVWEGYCGALMQFGRVGTGRILAPFAEWLPGVPTSPPTGPHRVMAIYSDDAGVTWKQSASRLVAPCVKGFNGNNYGACEPAVIELREGRLYMLMRTQTGYLYESWSHDDGATWSPAEASRFHASSSPPGLVRLADGRIVVLWNHCQMPLRVEGEGVYGGRDALHAAISDDEGQTWRGFREIYRDSQRNETPPKSGDRGTAYPSGAYDQNGNLVVVSGQGRGRRHVALVDPDWLTSTLHEDDFSAGADGWHCFKAFGPAKGYWRDRTIGGQLVALADAEGGRALLLGKPDEKDADGACWNFPLGRSGALTLRLQPQQGFGGAALMLTDRMFEPTDPTVADLAAVRCEIDAKGVVDGGLQLECDQWQRVTLRWDLDAGECRLEAADASVELGFHHPLVDGLSYLHIQSLAQEAGEAGLLVDSARVVIENPMTPAGSAAPGTRP